MVDTDGFRKAHDELEAACGAIVDAARRLPALTPEGREEARAEALVRLGDVEAHMTLDERVLFHEVSGRLGDPLATASMSYDHLAIRDWLQRVRAADVTTPEPLQQLLYGLDALIRVHLWKENELYLAMLESGSWPTA